MAARNTAASAASVRFASIADAGFQFATFGIRGVAMGREALRVWPGLATDNETGAPVLNLAEFDDETDKDAWQSFRAGAAKAFRSRYLTRAESGVYVVTDVKTDDGEVLTPEYLMAYVAAAADKDTNKPELIKAEKRRLKLYFADVKRTLKDNVSKALGGTGRKEKSANATLPEYVEAFVKAARGKARRSAETAEYPEKYLEALGLWLAGAPKA